MGHMGDMAFFPLGVISILANFSLIHFLSRE